MLYLALLQRDAKKKKKKFSNYKISQNRYLFSASLKYHKIWSHWAYNFPWRQLAKPFGIVYAPKLLSVQDKVMNVNDDDKDPRALPLLLHLLLGLFSTLAGVQVAQEPLCVGVGRGCGGVNGTEPFQFVV